MLFMPLVDQYMLVDIDSPPPEMHFELEQDLKAQAPSKGKFT